MFVALIKGEIVSGTNRGEIAQHILDDASTGRWPVFTSTFTIVEVLRDRSRPMLTEVEEKRIDDFFKHEYIKLVAIDREVAEHARRLARIHNLRPADAVHLACAIKGKAEELLTWDKDFPQTSIEGVRIREPYWFGQTQMSFPDRKG